VEVNIQVRPMSSPDEFELGRKKLIELLAAKSAKLGEFKLSSGRMSTLYIDARVTTMSPEGLSLIGPLGLEALRASAWRVDSIGGLTLGADPIAYAISYASSAGSGPLRAFTVRKEVKQHGTGKIIEGAFFQGDHVAVIEDVITTGSSAMRAIEALRAGGATISGVLGLVDREEGGRDAIEQAGYSVISLVTASEITKILGAT
jgi:orotate phosphoribosyltransferase